MDGAGLTLRSYLKISYGVSLQLKANGGDVPDRRFWSLQISPTDSFNRWIVPLESSVDFLRLQSGQTARCSFKQLIVFSTNLDPNQLRMTPFYGGSR